MKDPRNLSPHLVKWVNGRCADMALAILSIMPEDDQSKATLVGFGQTDRGFDHVGVFLDNLYYDARGELNAEEFTENFPYEIEDIETISLDIVEFQCGLTQVEFPYDDIDDIEEARHDAKNIFPYLEC